MFIVSLTLGHFVTYIGITRCIWTGSGITAVSSIGFGLLQFVNTKPAFFALAVLFRVLEAIGTGAFATGGLTLIVEHFNRIPGQMFSVSQVIYGVGSALGPIVGGGLAVIGGFMLPFEVVGGILVVFTLILLVMFKVVPRNQHHSVALHRNKPSASKALKHPTILLACFRYVIESVRCNVFLCFMPLAALLAARQ